MSAPSSSEASRSIKSPSSGNVEDFWGVFGVDDCSSSRYSLLYLGRSSSSPIDLIGSPFVPKPLFIALFSNARPKGSFLGVNTSVGSSLPAPPSSPPNDNREDLFGFFFPFNEPDRLIAGRTTTGPSSSSTLVVDASPRLSPPAGLKLFLKPDCLKGFRPDFAPNNGLEGSVFARVSLDLISKSRKSKIWEYSPSLVLWSPVVAETSSLGSSSSATLMTLAFRFAAKLMM
ncbi:hypothetical protein HG531_001978 [Fusarium graminearum]|nr:hypothetical protein HG531_001978 [Fusarium graminearum]